MNRSLKRLLQYVFFAGLGIFLVWWSIKDLNDDDKYHIREALSHARYILLLPVFCILMLSHFVRSLRWRLLIEPLGYTPSRANSFFAVMIGYLTNQAVPRLGEVLKCTILSRYEKIPADKLIGTIIVERLVDAITLLTIFAITLLIQPTLYNDLVDTFFHSSSEKVDKGLPLYIVVLIVVGILVLIAGIWMYFSKKRFRDLGVIIIGIWRSVIKGVGTIRQLKNSWLFIFYSITIWFLYYIAGYIGFNALKETEIYGVKEAFAILSAGSVGMIATPGGIGAYALLIEGTMQIYGLQKGVALAFGWLLWLAQTGVILIGGVLSFVLIPYFNRRKNESIR